ncbi:MAG: hypothetical protein ACLFQA_00300 [Bacteroidales bacterium]
MTTIAKAAKNYGDYRNLIMEILDAEKSNIAYRFDEFEVVEMDDCNIEDYPYDSNDIDIARGWAANALDELTAAVESAGLEMEIPYNDSIYIHKGNGRAITIRSHEIANSTWRHWDELFSYNFGQSIDDHIINEL